MFSATVVHALSGKTKRNEFIWMFFDLGRTTEIVCLVPSLGGLFLLVFPQLEATLAESCQGLSLQGILLSVH